MSAVGITGTPAGGSSTGSRRPAPGHAWSSAAGILVGSVLAGVTGMGLAQLGTMALYGLAGVVAVAVVLWSIRDLVGPWCGLAWSRVVPRSAVAHPTRISWPRRLLVGFAVTILAGVLGLAVAQAGFMAAGAVAALLVGAVVVLLAWPLVVAVTRSPVEAPIRWRLPDVAWPQARSPLARIAVGATAVVIAGGAALVLAQMGMKGAIAAVGAVTIGLLLIVVVDRTLFFTFATVSSLTFVLHKSLSGQDLYQSGGAISIYVTTFDVMLLLLYGLWAAEGTLLSDLWAARKRRVLWLPLIGALFLLPSLLASPSMRHSLSELVRMGWMFLLYLYIAVRVRTRRHIWSVLAGLGVFVLIELVVVVLQAKTGGVLGLSFLGVPKQLGERVTDTAVLGRPFGTIIHPVFMGAVMGSTAMVALGLALTLRRSLAKVSAIALMGAALLPLYLAHTRASLVAFAMVAGVMVLAALLHRQLQWSTIARAAVALACLVVLFWPQIESKFLENFGTGHFDEEVQSRKELNDIGGAMFRDHPAIGVGLNTFELQMGPYEKYGIIFFNNPVHNLYLLYLAETGVVGFVGVVLVGVGMYDVAIRLARSPDPLFGGIGLGVSGAMAFLMIEELLGFSLRQDIPLAMYWLLAGLAVSARQLAGFEGPRVRSRRGQFRPVAPASPSMHLPAAQPAERVATSGSAR